MQKPYVHPSTLVEDYTLLSPDVHVWQQASVAAGVVLMDSVDIGARSIIGAGSRLEQGVTVGPEVTIGALALILEDAVICPNKVITTSTNARQLNQRVIVGSGVLLHDQVELNDYAIVPTQRTIIHIGELGAKNRVITIYGSDEGPRYSLGCNMGVSYTDLAVNVTGNAANPGGHTTYTSAGSYVPYLRSMNELGTVVQSEYDREANLVAEMKDMWTRLVA